jgi:hypothetical protein
MMHGSSEEINSLFPLTCCKISIDMIGLKPNDRCFHESGRSKKLDAMLPRPDTHGRDNLWKSFHREAEWTP